MERAALAQMPAAEAYNAPALSFDEHPDSAAADVTAIDIVKFLSITLPYKIQRYDQSDDQHNINNMIPLLIDE